MIHGSHVADRRITKEAIPGSAGENVRIGKLEKVGKRKVILGTHH